MYSDIFVIFSFFLINIFASINIIRQDLFFGGLYIFLFIYSFFAVLGYCFYPEESVSIRAYFGEDILPDIYIFLFASFVFLFFLINLTKSIWNGRRLFLVSQERQGWGSCLIILLAHYLYQLFYLYQNFESLTYGNVGDYELSQELGIKHRLFMYQFKLMPLINLVLYFCARAPNINGLNLSRRQYSWSITSLHLILFLFISARIGSRTDPLAWILGLLCMESSFGSLKKIPWKKIFKMGVTLIAMFFLISILPQTRELSTFDSELTIMQKIIRQDYFAPAHMLFAAVAFDYVNPVEVLKSNFANALVLMKYPYLQESVTELFNPGVTTRSASYAFYIFTEGYIFLGADWGWIYNGIVVVSGGILFRLLASSADRRYNLLVMALICTQVVNLVRGQSSYFIKDLYILFAPALFFLWLATGLRAKLFKKRN